MKFPYDLPFLPGASPPGRWDVVVFRYPEEPEVSYIKRLVGLPGETIRDLLRRRLSSSRPAAKNYQLARKPLRHQQAMQMMVYDDPHRPDALAERPEWRRWRSRRRRGLELPVESDTQPLQVAPKPRPKRRSGPSCATATSSPTPSSGTPYCDGRELPRPPRATLITDFYSYNTNLTAESSNLRSTDRAARSGRRVDAAALGRRPVARGPA